MANRGPYDEYKSSPLWKTVETAIHDLVENQDLTLTTLDYYVVGYLVKNIVEKNSEQPKP